VYLNLYWTSISVKLRETMLFKALSAAVWSIQIPFLEVGVEISAELGNFLNMTSRTSPRFDLPMG